MEDIKIKVKGVELTAEEIAGVMTDMLNSYGTENIDTFIKKMLTEHRTLQQSFTRFCMKWVEAKAAVEYFDGRDEQSVKLCREILEKVPNLYLQLV